MSVRKLHSCRCCSCHIYALHGYHAGWCHAVAHENGEALCCDCETCTEDDDE